VNRRAAAAGVAVLVALVAGAVVVAVRDGGETSTSTSSTSTSSTPTSPTSTSTTSTTAARPEVDRVVTEVEAFVVAARGKVFKQPVPVTLLDGKAFADRLLADAEESRDDIERSQRALRAIGLLDHDVDLFEVLQRFLGDAVVGFYDAEKGDLVVRGSGTFTPYARSVLAHELTHALDDQWFELDRPALEEPENSEASSAFAALVEGDAERVEASYRAQMSTADRVALADEERRISRSIDFTGVPPILPEIIGWPYEAGPTFVRALLTAGGEPRVDAAFAAPPTTTAEIDEPDRYLRGDRPVEVDEVAAEGTVLERGVYGHASLVDTLAPVLGEDRADRAADGWAGDAYVLWDAGADRSCIRATFAMQTGADLDELRRALLDWADGQGADVQSAAGTVTFTACG
jgi:hypothetical protein